MSKHFPFPQPRLPAAIVFFILCGASFLQATPAESDHASVDLIAEQDAIVPGESFNLAFHFELEEKWHIYWQNPGASGLPPEIDWDLTEGFEAGDIQWPTPDRFTLDGLVNYGYGGAVTLIVPMEAPASLRTGETLRLAADISWIICKDICLPGDASLSIELPVKNSSQAGSKAELFDTTREKLPEDGAPWTLEAYRAEEMIQLRLVADKPDELPEELYFYAADEGIIDPNPEQPLNFVGPETARLALQPAASFPEDGIDNLRGVLQTGSGSWLVDVPLREGAPGDPAATPTKEEPGAPDFVPDMRGLEGFLLDSGIAGWLALAFIGGLILNITPCVLPVLSLKVFALLNHAGQARSQSFFQGLAYTSGVVISFLILAGALFALRALGEQIGWGFQLQNPGFVAVLAILFFLFGLNLLGVYEIGGSLIGADSGAARRKDLLGSFGMGVLATVVGAPCVGPFIGAVGGIAVQATTWHGLLIFGSMGLGLASPFLLLSIFPQGVKWLPKPGPWMETFKQLMGFLLLSAVVFLAFVMGRLGGTDAMLTLLMILLMSGFSAWIYGRWGAPVRATPVRRTGKTIALVLLALTLAFGVRSTAIEAQNQDASSETSDTSGMWKKWSSERAETALEKGRPVFVDFTAAWCLICQANKKSALETDATRQLFEEYNILALRADWTRRDASITKELERFDRSGVPLYVLHTPEGDVSILPQNLNNGIVRDAVENALD
ncbi:MAG: protein-disulfide reductase DsbD family protein [Opitutales bacterium]